MPTTSWKSLFAANHFAVGAVMIVPTELVRRQISEEILAEREVVMGPRVMTFNVLEKLLSSELGAAPMDSMLRLMAINVAAPDLWKPLGLPGQLDQARVLDLADQLGDGFDRLRLAGVTYEALEALEPKAVTSVLADVFRRFDAWRGERDDEHSRRRKLIEALTAGRGFRFLAEVEVVWCLHSARLSPFETEFLKALASQLRVELQLSAPAWLLAEEIPPGAGYHRLKLIRELEKSEAPGLNLTWADPGVDSADIPEALRYASENLFGPWPKTPAPDPGGVLTITRTPYRYHEAEEVARRVKALMAAGVPARKIGVAVPSVAGWVPHLRDCFRRFRLTMRYTREVPLSDYPPVAALLDLFVFFGSNWELRRIVKILESPYFSFNVGHLLRPYLADIGITDTRAAGGFKVNFDKISDPALKEKLRPVYKAAALLKDAEMSLVSAKSWKSFRDRLQGIVKDFGWPGTAPAEPPAQSFEHPFFERAAADSVAVERMAECLGRLFDCLVNSHHAPQIGLESFRLWLGRVMGETFMPGLGGAPMGVHVMNYFDLHGARFEALFLMGLNDKVFPSASAEDCWWPEELVEALAGGALGRRLWSSASDSYRQQEDMVAQALSQARRVFISFQSNTEDQRPALPSPLVDSLVDLFGKENLPVESVGWPLPPPADCAAEPGELWLNLAVRRPGDEPPGVFREISGLPPAEVTDLWKSVANRRRRLNNYQTQLKSEQVAAWLATLRRHAGRPLTSVRPLTAYATCPRAFWYGQILDLAPWSGPLETWPSAAQGEVVHQTLERFLAPLLTGEELDYAATRLKYIYWEVVHRHFCSRPIGRKPVYEALSKKIETSLMSWLERHGNLAKLNLAALEWSFGPSQGHSAPPFEVESPSGSFYLTGRVDRIDRQGGHVVVRDYKISRTSYYGDERKPADGFRPAWHYPMILYALAAGAHFKADARAVIEFVDPKEGTDQLVVEDGDAKEFSDLWELLLQGRLTKAPKAESCGYCGYARLCRPAALQTES
ncbi:MAG: PD-(D/E)XK nuclease family protein [Deltaproteobacteria bacterium]|jgi:hypothetical protein|nr:PD-(D/E)XK nuclease family protein [Deltaproteobacteria bacterium]